MLLRPDPETNRIFVFALAVAAQRFGVRVHGFCVMSTHSHIVLTDERGNLPTFLQWFHRAVALAVKVHRRWEGTVWDANKTSVVRLETYAAFIDKLAYVLANPVEAGLVERSQAWPGARSIAVDLAYGSHAATLPSCWFDRLRGGWPANATLHIGPPPFVEDIEATIEDVRAVLAEKERAARHARRRFAGAARSKQTSPFRRASSREQRGTLNPTFAVGHGAKAARLDAIAALRAFRTSYHEALHRFRSGERDTVFPAGTWWMAVAHGVNVERAAA